MQNQTRIIIESVKPQLDGGSFYIKRIVNQKVIVSAHVFADGHDVVECCVKFKHEKDKKWSEVRMSPTENDEWEAEFIVEKQGFYSYFIEGWVDYALNWQHGTERKIKDNQHVKSELLEGAEYCQAILKEVTKEEKAYLNSVIKAFQDAKLYDSAIEIALSDELHQIFKKYPTRTLANSSAELKVYVDRKKALFSTWYEFFPRSASETPGKHGTFKDCERLLPRVAEMGFDTLYFPPIHPIGEVNRKGKNNATTAEKGDVGSPWGIGSKHGGHKSTHPELGTIDDFKALVKKAQSMGIEIAMDYALQAAPDHPYVKDFPQWFKWRPDGTVQYAENPPKKYQDIYPIYFETNDWKNLWLALKDVIFTWAEWGVRIIRVDNPHTKSFNFWEWVIAETKSVYPDMIFLSEAFTKPKVMQQLAKLGFTQSYTYYVWRTTKQEIMEYMTELVNTEMSEYFRPNFWPNTHDINPYMLQSGNENLFILRHFMAATLVSNYGIFGPSYEYMYHEANAPKEEYAYSEKYEIKWWDWKHENKLTYLISQINRIRKENTAFKATNNLTFCPIANDQLLAYLKTAKDGNRILCIANLSGNTKQEGMVHVPLSLIGKSAWESYRVHDLVTGMYYTWQGEQNFVSIDPYILPFHLFRIEDL